MMRPMKLAGSQLLFGKGCLAHLKTLTGRKAMIVTGGGSMARTGMLQKAEAYLREAGMEVCTFSGVQQDPVFSEVQKGAAAMLREQPDWIVALGGGSVMDAAKAMWVLYEHPEIETLAEMAPPNRIPKLRGKARLVCIPSTSGTASEVSRSIVITDDATGFKLGIGDMEMMPDVAICDPEVTRSMPPRITAETGMDAMTHALEALVSKRANYISDIFARRAAADIYTFLPKAVADGANLSYRERMLNASMAAGLAFTNVSLGIVHSIAHTLGSYFGIAHGVADAIVLPHVIRFNMRDSEAAERYASLGLSDRPLDQAIAELNARIGIPAGVCCFVPDRAAYEAKLPEMAEHALMDGCTKTNPVIPTVTELTELFRAVYEA